MRALFFGGTGFVGRHLVDAFVDAGHEVTLFVRGRSDPQAFSGLPRILGDRAADLSSVDPRAFDLVIDTSGYLPSEVRPSVERFAATSARYVFVSSISVYADHAAPADESTAVHAPIEDPPLTAPRYGGLKVACESIVTRAFGDRALVVRPGRIYGPHDSDPRMPWLLRRVAEGGEVLAAGRPDAPVQWIDARDLARFVVRAIQAGISGVFNTVSPPVEARTVYATIRDVVGGDARFTFAPDELVLAHHVKPFSEAPLWLPKEFENGARASSARAIEKGLAFRPLVETLRDEWAWMQTGWDAAASVRAQKRLEIDAGVTRDRERAILAAHHGRG